MGMNVILCALGLSYAGMASLSLAMDVTTARSGAAMPPSTCGAPCK